MPAELDTELEALLNPRRRYALILEFPDWLEEDRIDARIESVLGYARDVINPIDGRVVGYYEEDYV